MLSKSSTANAVGWSGNWMHKKLAPGNLKEKQEVWYEASKEAQASYAFGFKCRRSVELVSKYIHDMTIPTMVQDKYALTPKEERSGEL